MVVKNAFGRLKGRWRRLLKTNDAATEDIPTIITTCCVLHNIREVYEEHFDETWLQGIEAQHMATAASTEDTSQSTQPLWGSNSSAQQI